MTLNVDDLSEEILVEILGKLDGKSLKNAALVCKSWNEIISTSTKTMRKFQLNLNARVEWDLKSLRRNFLHVKVDFKENESVNMFVEYLQNHGGQIRSLKMRQAMFDKIEKFLTVLRNCPLLENLQVEGLAFKNFGNDKFEGVKLEKLKHLHVGYTSDWRIFRCVEGSQPTTLTFSLTSGKEAPDNLVNFLLNSQKLERLDIDDTTLRAICLKPINFPIKLKQITSYANIAFTPEIAENISNFLKSQSGSLEDVYLRRFPASVFKTVFSDLKNLKKLRVERIPQEKSFYEKMKPIESLTEFECESYPDELLGLFPNLEKWKTSRGSDALSFVSNFNRNIKHLSIGSFRTKVDENVKLPRLEYFYIEFDINFEFLTTFLINNLSIVTFCSRYFKDNLQILDVLLNMPKLKHLKFGGEVSTMKFTFDHIKANPRGLETVEIIFEKVPGRPDVLFKVPEDLSKWDEKCRFLENYVKDARSEFGYRISVCHTSEFMY